MKKLLSSFTAAFFVCANVQAAPMTLNVHNSDLRSTIMMVAKTGGINISVDDSVDGKISMAIFDTEPEKILDIIAKTKNLTLLKDGAIYILTSKISGGALMKSYVLPVKFGDAETLRKAVVMSLDPDTETIADHVTRTRNNDGSYTYRYSYRENDSETGHSNTQLQRIKRDERVFVNPDTNSLVLFGTESEYERAKNLLAELDVELKQVSVEARILAIDKNASKNLGVEWSWSSIPQYPFGNDSGRPDVEGSFENNNGYGIFQFGRGPNGLPFEFYYSARINALVEKGKAKILSRPNVTTIQGHEAVINVGSSVPISKSSTTNSTVTTSFDYRDVGIILKYTPRINADGTITATIHTEVSTPQYVEDLKAYQFNTRSADTTVTVRDGEPMVIGGLIGAEDAKSISKIPFLGDLPILGALFRNHRKSKTESELMIFLTAHVINGAGVGVPKNVRYSVPAGGLPHEILSNEH